MNFWRRDLNYEMPRDSPEGYKRLMYEFKEANVWFTELQFIL